MLSKSLCGEEIARELINVLSVTYGVDSKYILGAMRDRASVNNVAMQTLKIIYPSIVDIGCFSHTIDHVGEQFKTPILADFMNSWLTLFSHSPNTRFLWKAQTGRSMATYSSTQWWSKWEVVKQLLEYFGDIKPFLDRNEDIGPATRPKLLSIMNDSQKLCTLKIEIAATVDWGEPFVKACYHLEGDGPLVFDCFETIDQVIAGVNAEHTPNVDAIAQFVSNGSMSTCQQWIKYSRSCIQPGLDYFFRQMGSTLKNSVEIFKGCRLFSPNKIHIMKPTAAAVEDALSPIPFLKCKERLDGLKSELASYLSRAADTDPDFPPLEWWQRNAKDLPNWSASCAMVLLIQPSSAAAERVFSILKASFGEQQDLSLQDYIEASLMLQYNNR